MGYIEFLILTLFVNAGYAQDLTGRSQKNCTIGD